MEDDLLFHLQQLKRIPLFKHGECGTQQAHPLLKATPDGRWCAVSARAPHSVIHLLEMGSTEVESAKLVGTFAPDIEGEISVCSWSKDGSILAAGATSGEMWVFTRGLEERLSCEQVWGRASLVGMEFTEEEILTVTGTGKAYLISTRGGSKSRMLCSFASQHSVVAAASLDEKGIIVVVGDGRIDKETAASRSAKLGSLQGLTISVWRMHGGKVNCMFNLGKKPARGMISFLFSASKDPLPCHRLSQSPDGNLVAVGTENGLLQILSIEQKALIETPQLGTDLHSLLMGVKGVSWWSSSVLAVISRDGSLQFISVPEFKLVDCKYSTQYPQMATAEAINEEFLLTLEPLFNKARCLSSVQLERVTKKIPEEMLQVLLAMGKEEDALELCRRHGLETDHVFVSLWRMHSVNHLSIMSYLEPIHDRVLVIKECTRRVATTSAEELVLLQFGLKVCDELLGDFSSEDEDMSESVLTYVELRLKLLGALDRLGTFLEINDEGYIEEAFGEFMVADFTEAALAYSASGNVHALQILLNRHTFSIYENFTIILNELPETLDSENWMHLIPRPNVPPKQLYKPHRPMDRWETKPVSDALLSCREQTSLEMTETLLSHQNNESKSFSMGEISAWCVERAKRVDGATGQMSTVRELLEQAVDLGLDAKVQWALNDAIILSSTIKEDSTEWNTSFSYFSEISLPKKLALLAKSSSSDSLTTSLKSKIGQLMEGLSVAEKHEALACFLCDEFSGRPAWVLKFVELEEQEGIAFRDQDSDPVNVYRLVSSVLTTVAPDGHWDELQQLASIAERSIHFSDEVSDEISTDAKDLSRIVEAGYVLSKYSINETMKTLQGMDEEAVVKLIRLLLSKSARGGRSWSDSKWKCLWRDLNSLTISLHANMVEATLLAEYCRALLRAGKASLAQEYFEQSNDVSMDQTTAEALIMSVGREFLYSASSLEDDSVVDAKACFELIPNVQAAKQELETLDALQQLPRFGFSLVPMQLKQLQSRIDVIPFLLQAQPDNYRDLEALRSIAELLGLRTHEEHLEVDLIIGEAALKAEDYKHAELIASGLVKGRLKKAWRLCLAIAQTGHEHITQAAQEALLVFAAAHCPDDELVGIIENLNRCQSADESTAPYSEASEKDFRLAISNTPSSVPLNIRSLSMGDAFYALNVVMRNPSLRIELENVQSFQEFERATAMSLVSNLLKVVPKESVARHVMASPLENLLSMGEGSSQSQQFGHVSEEITMLRRRMEAAKSARSMKALMPGVDVMRFAVSDGFYYRQQLVREEAAFAGEMLAGQDMPERRVWRALNQALDLAESCMIERAELASIFIVSTIVSAAHVTPAVDIILQEQKQVALEFPRLLVSRLCEYAWPEVLSHEYAKLSYVLRLIGDGQGMVGLNSEKYWAVSDLIEEFSDPLQGLDMKVFFNHLIQDALGQVDQYNSQEVTILQEVFGFVSSRNIAALSGFMNKLSVVAPLSQAVSISSLYLCLATKQVQLRLREPDHMSGDDYNLESPQNWEALLAHLIPEHIQKVLQWCCLSGQRPLEINAVVEIGSELSVPTRICALSTGLDLLRRVPTNSVEIDSLDQELRRLGALDSAQRLTGMTSSDFQALMSDDAAAESESGLENVIGRLLTSGSKVDVIFEVATSVARTRSSMDVDNVPKQLIAVLKKELGDAVETVLSCDSSQDLLVQIVDCLKVGDPDAPEAVTPFLSSWRESVWSYLSFFCSHVDGDDLLSERICKLLQLCKDLAEGRIWQNWPPTPCAATTMLASKLLYSKTRFHLGSTYSSEYSWTNLCSLEECQHLFLKILEEFTGEWFVLRELLRSVWSHGMLWKELEPSYDNVGVVPLHDCWIKLLLRMAKSGDMAGILCAVDYARDDSCQHRNGEVTSVLSLISASEYSDLIGSLDSQRNKVYVGLLMPFEDIRMSSALQISSIGCDAVLFALILEGGLLSTLLDDPATSAQLYGTIAQAPPHPSLINLWRTSQEEHYRDKTRHTMGPSSPDANMVEDRCIGNSLDDGWGNEWETRDADEAPDARVNDANPDPALSGGNYAPKSDEGSLQALMDDEIGQGWEQDDEDDWELTLLEAQRMANQHKSADHEGQTSTNDNLLSNDAASSRIENVGVSSGNVEARMGDMDLPESVSELEMLGDWGEDCDLLDTVEAAQQMTRDIPSADGELTPSLVNPPVEDIASMDGWEDDDLGELLEQAQCLPEAVKGTGTTVDSPDLLNKPTSADREQVEQNSPRIGRNNPSTHTRCESDDWSQRHVGGDHVLRKTVDCGAKPVDKCLENQEWNEGDALLLACSFPLFIAHLCSLDYFMIAVSLVCDKMRLHTGLWSNDARLAYLREYLKNVSRFPVDSEQLDYTISSCKLPRTVRRLIDQIAQDCTEALMKLQLFEPE